MHGKGVYARVDLKKGERLIEYKGEVITWKEALRRHPHDPKDPNHTFYFHIDDKHVIDAKHGGNDARWINHSCAPNCESNVEEGRVFIDAVRDIKAGEELFYDYGLVIDEPLTPELKAEYPCWCGSANCRGTLLATSDAKSDKKKKKKKEKKSKDAVKEKAEKKSEKKSGKKANKKADKKADMKAGKASTPKAVKDKAAKKPKPEASKSAKKTDSEA